MKRIGVVLAPHQRSFSPGVVALVLFLLLLAAGLGWAGRTVLTPPQEEAHAPSYALATTVEGSLGRDLKLAAHAQWVEQSGLNGKLQGTLTSIPLGRESRINPGDLLYTVDLQPVFVMPGTVPAFRDMARDVEGDDVAQLQEYLFGAYGWALTPDGKFGISTEELVKIWQKEHKLEQTGVIPAGQILFVPSMPVSISWETDIKVGSELQPGTKLLKLYGDNPSFTMNLPEGELRAAHEGQSVTLEYQGNTWMAQIGTIAEDTENHKLIATLIPAQGQNSICQDQCHLIPSTGLKGISAAVVLIPEQTGIQIPISALRVNAQGQTVIVDQAGTQHPVTVLTSVGGQAIVNGIDAGMKIRVWSTNLSNGTSTPSSTPEPGQSDSPETPNIVPSQSGQ